MSSSSHIPGKYLDFGHHFQGLVRFFLWEIPPLFHALRGQWLCQGVKGAGFGWDPEDAQHSTAQTQLSPGKCCRAHSHSRGSLHSTVPGVGMPRVTLSIWVAQTANLGSGAFKRLEEEILKAAVGDLPNQQSKPSTWEGSCRAELQVGPC